MAANKASALKQKQKPEKQQVSIPPAAIVIALVVAAGLAGFWYLNRPAKEQPPPPLTPEARAYVRNLRLTDVQMKATESYVKQSLVEITGQIGNAGDRPLRNVMLTCVFYDAYGQLVLRRRVPIVNQAAGALTPGTTRKFRLAFDDIPESWNQTMPQLVIAWIDFA